MRKLESSIQKDLESITKQLSKIKEVVAVLLYGSHARGDAGPRSDIDILVIFDKEKNVRKHEPKISDLLFGKTKRFVQPVCVALDHPGDPGLLSRVFREGKVIFVKKPLPLQTAAILDLLPKKVITFSIAHLKPKDKWKFNHALYGKKVAGYKYKGLLEEINGRKLGDGAIIVPEQEMQRIIELFKRYKVKHQTQKVWTEEL